MGSGSSVSVRPTPESRQRQLQTNMSVTSGYPLSDPELQPSHNHNLTAADLEPFTPHRSGEELGGGSAIASLSSGLETNVRSTVASSLSDRPPLSEDQESKVKSCLTSLEKLLKDSQLRFDTTNILLHARVIQLEGEVVTELFDHVGEGLFVVDSGTVDLLSSGRDSADNLPVIRLTDGDYCGEYSTIFNISFRTKAQFKTRFVRYCMVNLANFTQSHIHTTVLSCYIYQLISCEQTCTTLGNLTKKQCLSSASFSKHTMNLFDFLSLSPPQKGTIPLLSLIKFVRASGHCTVQLLPVCGVI